MPAIARFYPAIFSAIALLGCVLPFGTGGAGPGEANLLDFPSAMSQLGKLSSIFNPSDSSVSTGTASLIASLVYIVPVLAIVIIVLNFRGTVEKTLQLFTAIAWLLAIFFVPYFAILSLINSNPLLLYSAPRCQARPGQPQFMLALRESSAATDIPLFGRGHSFVPALHKAGAAARR